MAIKLSSGMDYPAGKITFQTNHNEIARESVKMTDMESLLGVLKDHIGELAILTRRADIISERLLGGSAEEASSQPPRAVPNGKLAEFAELLSGLDEEIRSLRSSMDRLSGAI